MRYAIFSDVHSNLQALESFIADARKERIDVYLCGGDIVGYCANPAECIAVVREFSQQIIAGNHDWACAGKCDIEYFNPLAKEVVFWTADRLDREEKEFLSSLPLIYRNEHLTLVHGSLQEPEMFRYMMDEEVVEETFNLMRTPICFVGHTHRPGVFTKEADRIFYTKESAVKLRPKARYIINAGSVGQPRDFNNRAAYCIFDTEARTVVIKRVEYDIKEAQRRMQEAGLPEYLRERIAAGR